MDKSYSRTIEGAVRFALWAQSLRSFPTVQQIVDHFDCSRASAYRYRHAYAAAQGFPTPPNPAGETVAGEHRCGHSRNSRVLTRDLKA